MARKVTTKRRAQQEESLSDLFKTLGSEQTPEVEASSDNEEDTTENKDPAKELMERFSALTQQVDALAKANAALLQTQPKSPGTALQEPKLDLSTGMPDPQYDNEAYNREVAARVQGFIQAKAQYDNNLQAQTREEAEDKKSRADRLWADYKRLYPEKAEDSKRTLFAAQQVFDDARARGIDPEKYMFTHREQFLKDVATQYDAVFGPTKTDDDTLEVEIGDDRRVEHGDTIRTMGVFGGQGAPAGRRKAKGEDPGDMIADLQAEQLKSGFF